MGGREGEGALDKVIGCHHRNPNRARARKGDKKEKAKKKKKKKKKEKKIHLSKQTFWRGFLSGRQTQRSSVYEACRAGWRNGIGLGVGVEIRMEGPIDRMDWLGVEPRLWE